MKLSLFWLVLSTLFKRHVQHSEAYHACHENEAAQQVSVDAALLDVNLNDELVFPAADILVERFIPMVFLTGYSCTSLPPRFRAAPCLETPFVKHELARILETALGWAPARKR